MSDVPTIWRCFHCDTVFMNRKHAAEHFGRDEGDVPACKLSSSEGHLVTYIRKLQAELNSHREERDEILLAWHARDAEHHEALRREEEKGFTRGVEDMKKHGYRIAETDWRTV